jgi:hypothetical protein
MCWKIILMNEYEMDGQLYFNVKYCVRTYTCVTPTSYNCKAVLSIVLECNSTNVYTTNVVQLYYNVKYGV